VNVGADTPAKLVGSYERELHPVIELLASQQFQTIVNVGCADGYYAVGMALRCPGATVRAYEILEEQQASCRATAEANGVGDRILVDGECTAADLAALDREALVIMDCEGAEDTLLSSPMLATVLVELHDWEDKTLPARVLARYTNSHDVELIHSEPRATVDFPQLSFLSPADHELALFERYTPMEWAVIRPKK
jgi:hypothetical protein